MDNTIDWTPPDQPRRTRNSELQGWKDKALTLEGANRQGRAIQHELRARLRRIELFAEDLIREHRPEELRPNKEICHAAKRILSIAQGTHQPGHMGPAEVEHLVPHYALLSDDDKYRAAVLVAKAHKYQEDGAPLPPDLVNALHTLGDPMGLMHMQVIGRAMRDTPSRYVEMKDWADDHLKAK